MSTKPEKPSEPSTPSFLSRISMGNWISVVALCAAIIGSYALAQAQIQDHERRLVRLELRDEQARIDYAAVRELLVRIDERTVEIKRRQDIDK